MSPFVIECSDPELQGRLERMSSVDVGLPPELRPVFALMDAYDCYRLEEEDAPKREEIIRLLLSPELRPALRKWYEGPSGEMNWAALQFRDRLGELAGEKFK